MTRAQRIGGQIKRFRELAGLSKSDLARRVGVSPTAVNNWEENGVIPRMNIMFALERALEVDLLQLMSARDSREASAAANTQLYGSAEVSRGERLDQFRRQIAALFDVSADRVDIVIRT